MQSHRMSTMVASCCRYRSPSLSGTGVTTLPISSAEDGRLPPLLQLPRWSWPGSGSEAWLGCCRGRLTTKRFSLIASLQTGGEKRKGGGKV